MADVKMEKSSIDASELPNNSLVAKQKKAKEPVKVLKPVAEGELQKKSFGARFVETLGLSDGRTVTDYLMWDVAIPAVKDLINNLVTNGISILLYGNAKPRNIDRNRQVSRVSYGRYYEERTPRSPSYSYNSRAAMSFADVTFKTRNEAEMVLSEMVECIDMYDFVRVSDFLTLSNVSEDEIHFTDHNLGWDALGSVEVVPVHVHGGTRWALTLPKPIGR